MHFAVISKEIKLRGVCVVGEIYYVFVFDRQMEVLRERET